MIWLVFKTNYNIYPTVPDFSLPEFWLVLDFSGSLFSGSGFSGCFFPNCCFSRCCFCCTFFSKCFFSGLFFPGDFFPTCCFSGLFFFPADFFSTCCFSGFFFFPSDFFSSCCFLLWTAFSFPNSTLWGFLSFYPGRNRRHSEASPPAMPIGMVYIRTISMIP